MRNEVVDGFRQQEQVVEKEMAEVALDRVHNQSKKVRGEID